MGYRRAAGLLYCNYTEVPKLTAESDGKGIVLSWEASSNFSSYTISRKPEDADDDKWKVIASGILPEENSYTDDSVKEGKTYEIGRAHV